MMIFVLYLVQESDKKPVLENLEYKLKQIMVKHINQGLQHRVVHLLDYMQWT